MVKRSKQEIERHYFEKFCKDYQLPDGKPIYGDKPDVIWEGRRKIGIEITNLFIKDGRLPESEQVQRKKREEVISKAHQDYLRSGGRRIEFTFSFKHELPIQNSTKLARVITALAKNIDRLGSGQIRQDVFRNIPELSSIYLYAKECENPRWRVVQSYSVPPMSIKKLRKTVSIKEKKSRNYKCCDAYWLIAVVNLLDSAQDQEIRIDGFPKIVSSVFEKIIVYKTVTGEVFEAK
jgi:hypothetical protein